MNLNHKTNFLDGDPIHAEDWNKLAEDVNSLGQAAGNGGSNVIITETTEDIQNADKKALIAVVSGVTEIGSPAVIELTKKSKGVNTTLMSSNNVNIESRESTGKAKSTKGGNISMKPGDDIELCSHHRRFGNRDEVTVKVIDGKDAPVKLQIKAADITLSTEGKDTTMAKDEDTGLDTNTPLYDDPNVMNVNVTTGDGKGYLKVRAQAIDLRCEENGGIALLPRGEDSSHHMNKIKFEHGGGDGLEFGTFNAEKTSIYTPEYRFKKDGVIKLATRTLLDNTPGEGGNDKYTGNNQDPTTHYSYQKNVEDDFYDNIDANDPTCTWEDIIKFIAWAKTNKSGKDWASIWTD